MAYDTKWDTSRLTSMLGELREQRSIIGQNKDFLIKINEEVQTAWQGYAGRAFDQRLEIDAENLKIFIKSLDSLINDVEMVIKDCYEECEDDIQNEINSLKNMI